MDVNLKIQVIVETWGADWHGVADLSLAHDFILAQGGAEVAVYPRAISVGIALPHAIVDQLPQRANRAVAVSYRHNYDVTNQRLDMLTAQLAGFLQREGYRALPIPAAKRVDSERICAVFSHKLAAHLAGLGWIGKSCLLVTPQAGPRARWATVLTDAPLAATGAPFRADEPRERRYDARKCERYFDAMKAKDTETAVCGLCLSICPYGKQSSVQAKPVFPETEHAVCNTY
jgi:epoxyqueuosine reductase